MDAAVRVLAGAGLIAGVRARRRPGSPAELARRLDPNYRVTPTIKLIDQIAVRSITQPSQRDIVNTPPRTGKSELLAVYLAPWALQRDHDFQIIMTAHTDDLAQEFSRKARQIIRENADYLGFRIAVDKTATGRWTVEAREPDGAGGYRWSPRRGGVLAVGIHSGITGMGADFVLIDDPIKSMEEAESVAHRRRVWSAYTSVIAPRVHPGGSICVVHTRWHERDLAGELLAGAPGRWRHVNIPAVADGVTPDALGRPAGAAMVSALGYTAEDFAEFQASLGERVWSALYLGQPKPLAGGLVKREWLEAWRLPAAPRYPVRTVVGVDPSDSGSGDSCGVVAASITGDGVVAVIADVSAPMTSDQWARAAVDLAVSVGASEIVVEGFAAAATYTRVVREALGRIKTEWPIAVSSWPPKGASRVGDAVARSAGLLQALEVGTCRIAGHLPEFESAAVLWQAGKHQPDSLAAAVVAFDTLVAGRARRGLGLAGVPGSGGGVAVLRRSVGW